MQDDIPTEGIFGMLRPDGNANMRVEKQFKRLGQE
jgi:hypothetical protein